MANKVFQYYKELPPWAKGVVIVGGLAVTYIFASQIIGGIRRKKDAQKQLAEVNTAKNDLKELAKVGIKPTLSASQLEAMCAAIIDAVNGCFTSNNKIEAQIAKLNNDADVLALISQFGLRKKIRCVFSGEPREDFWSQYTPPMSLLAHLQDDLSAGDIKSLNSILAKKKINYNF